MAALFDVSHELMLHHLVSFTIGMAFEAGIGVPHITGHIIMLISHISLVVLVAVDAAENSIIGRVGMAI